MTEPSINKQVHKSLQGILSQATSDNASEQVQLNNALRLLSKWRSVLIQNTLLQQQGTVVMQGPLAGMDFLPQSAEGCHIAKLLGCYEQPLQPFIEPDPAFSPFRRLAGGIGAWRSPVSAPVWGTGGRRFESSRSDHEAQSFLAIGIRRRNDPLRLVGAT